MSKHAIPVGLMVHTSGVVLQFNQICTVCEQVPP